MTDSASTEAYINGNYGQSTMSVDGVQQAGFCIGAKSIYDMDSVHRVFGEASYSWMHSLENRWVENNDRSMLYPYLTVDTIGGPLRTESYYFRGGYRMLRQHVMWHAALQFRAEQSYRSVDPRPKNKVADIRVDASVAYRWNNYAFGVALQGGRYKQSNAIKFYSELGEAIIFHMIAPGVDYSRFAGSQKLSYYHGYTAGVHLYCMPHAKGWIAAIDYDRMRVTKELHDNTYIPLSSLSTHSLSGQVGYADLCWRVLAAGGVIYRIGRQHLYGEVNGSYYTPLSIVNNYDERQYFFGANADYSIGLPLGKITMKAALHYLLKSISSPEDKDMFAELSGYMRSNICSGELSLRYAFPIKSRYSWFVEPAASMRYYTNTARHSWQAALHTGITFY